MMSDIGNLISKIVLLILRLLWQDSNQCKSSSIIYYVEGTIYSVFEMRAVQRVGCAPLRGPTRPLNVLNNVMVV